MPTVSSIFFTSVSQRGGNHGRQKIDSTMASAEASTGAASALVGRAINLGITRGFEPSASRTAAKSAGENLST